MSAVKDPSDTSGRLIAASKVNGTSVYNRQGEKLGTVYDIMLEKISGKPAYAILSFGGFLGIGDRYHPLPWSVLTYDKTMGGFVVDLDRRTLEGAPTYGAGETVSWEDEGWNRRVHDYYGTPWGSPM